MRWEQDGNETGNETGNENGNETGSKIRSETGIVNEIGSKTGNETAKVKNQNGLSCTTKCVCSIYSMSAMLNVYKSLS